MISDNASAVMKPRSVVDDLQELGGRAKDMAKDRFDQVRTGTADAADKVKDKAHEVERSVEEFVREQPMKALLIAAGVGLVLGRFLIR